MISRIIENFKKKSLKWRFLLVITFLIFIAFWLLGGLMLFWDKLRGKLPENYRIIIGILIIIFGFLRFITQLKRLNTIDDE